MTATLRNEWNWLGALTATTNPAPALVPVAVPPGTVASVALTQSTINTTTGLITTTGSHGMVSGDPVSITAGTTAPAGLAVKTPYQIEYVSATTFYIHLTANQTAQRGATTGRIIPSNTGTGTIKYITGRITGTSTLFAGLTTGDKLRVLGLSGDLVVRDTSSSATALQLQHAPQAEFSGVKYRVGRAGHFDQGPVLIASVIGGTYSTGSDAQIQKLFMGTGMTGHGSNVYPIRVAFKLSSEVATCQVIVQQFCNALNGGDWVRKLDSGTKTGSFELAITDPGESILYIQVVSLSAGTMNAYVYADAANILGTL